MAETVEQRNKRLSKNAQISRSRKETAERRLSQVTKTIDIKLNHRRFTKEQTESLHRLFLEAKWIYNDALSQKEPENYVPRKAVFVKTRNGKREERSLIVIGSQVKQSVIAQLKNNLKSLKKLKDKGRKIGRLKFAREVKEVEFKQYGKTHSIKPDGTVKLQGLPGVFYAHGLEQLDESMELGLAKLIHKPSGYHLRLTVFIDKEDIVDDYIASTVIGIDMGVATHLTFSSGEKISASVEAPQRIKRIQRSMQRQYDHALKEKKRLGLNHLPLSQRYFRNRQRLLREYEKLGNRKNNLAYQLASRILKNEHVFIQDEMIVQWKIRYGKSLHHSVIGRIKAILSRHNRVYVLNRSEPTTQFCNYCEGKTKHGTEERIYTCSYCGFTDDRDYHASDNMILMGAERFDVPVDCGELTRVPIGDDVTQWGCGYIHNERNNPADNGCFQPASASSVKREETNPSLVGW